MNDAEKHSLPPEGARWKKPDWEPTEQRPTTIDALKNTQNLEGKPHISEIDVPLTLNDFRDHWEVFWRYAAIEFDDLQFFNASERLIRETELLYDFIENIESPSPGLANNQIAAPVHGFFSLCFIFEWISKQASHDTKVFTANICNAAISIRNDVFSILTEEQRQQTTDLAPITLTAVQVDYIIRAIKDSEVWITIKRIALHTFGIINSLSSALNSVGCLPAAGAGDTKNIQLSLKQVECLFIDHNGNGDWDSYFSIDLVDWREYRAHGIASEKNLSDSQIEKLKEYSPFKEWIKSRPKPHTNPTVPLSLEDFHQNWSDLAHLAFVRSGDKSIESVDKYLLESGLTPPNLTDKQRSELADNGETYFTFEQNNRFYKSGWQHIITANSWLELRNDGRVSENHLCQGDVEKLLSVPFFRDLNESVFKRLKQLRPESVGTSKTLTVGKAREILKFHDAAAANRDAQIAAALAKGLLYRKISVIAGLACVGVLILVYFVLR